MTARQTQDHQFTVTVKTVRIKKFYIYYGAPGEAEQFLKKGRDIYYNSAGSPFVDLRHKIPDEAIRTSPDKRKWKCFLAAARSFSTYWGKEYFNHRVDDGIQWEIRIITGDFTFKSHGSNAFPDDFEDFLNAVREFTGVKDFAGNFVSKLFMFD